MFDDMSIDEVVWDEDRPPELHMNSDMLQQLAQGGEDLIDEDKKPTTALFFIDEFCLVHNASFISGLADDSINEVFTERPLEMVIWGEAIDQVLLDDGKASNEQIAAEVQLVSKDTADKVFHEIATEIIWDEELLQSPNKHDGLLQQVSRSGEYLVAKERKPSVELKINGKLAHVDGPSFILDLGMEVVHENFDEMHLADVISDQELLHSPKSHGLLLQLADGDELLHVQQEAGLDECLVVDKRAIIDLVINDLIPHDSDMDTADKLFNDMPLEVRWDEERQSDIGTHESLLQHLSLSVDDELTKHMVKLNASVVLTPVSTSCLLNQCMNAADLVFNEFLQGEESQDSLLELLAHGECSIGMDNKPIAEPVCFKAPMAGELFDENHVGDDDPQYDTEPPDDMSLDVDHVVEPLTKDFQLLPNVEGSANEMENITEEIILVLCNDALWDGKVAGLSLFQESDTEVADIISIPYAFSLGNIFPLRNTDNVQVVSLINQNYCDLAHFGMLVRQHDAIIVGHQPELGMDAVDTVFDETPPEMFVLAAESLSDVCAAHGLLNGMLYQDVLWDDELLHHDLDGLLQQLDPELDDLMQGKLLSEEVICGSMVWDEIQAEIGMHHGLLQQLAQSGDYFDDKLIGSDKEILSLRAVAEDSRRKVQQLKYVVDELQFKFDCSLSHLGSMCNSLRNYEWTKCPSLNLKKGSLAGICPNEKIYASNGDGNETYSELEIYDLYLGKWICSPSMLLCRFALAASELNGVVHMSGGYDGNVYLESAERYDPRERFWVWLPSMSTKRGCRTLTVFGDTLNDIGRALLAICLNVPWDPGGNHDCFIPAIAWGQAMFCGGGNVIPRITGYMGLDIMGCRPCGFVLADKEWWLYRREARDGEGNRQYFRNTNQGLEGDLPPGYRDLLLRFPPVIAHVTGLISPAATGCDRMDFLIPLERRPSKS